MANSLTVSDKTRRLIRAVYQAESENFCDLMKIAKLDPQKDFMYSELSDVDFSNCDLRGFNFTGANLSGCFGINIVFDSSTVLDGADVGHSCFEYYREQQQFFAENDSWKALLDKMANAHFTTSVNWIADNLTEKTSFREGPWYVATRLLDATDSKVVRSNILYFALPLFRSTGGHLQFLLHVLTSRSAETSLVKSVATALASVYANEKTARLTLIKLLKHSESGIRKEAIRGLFNGGSVSDLIEEIIASISEEPESENRRYFLQRFCKFLDSHEGNGFSLWTTEPSGPPITIDFRYPIDDKLIDRIARRTLEQVRFAKHSQIILSSSLQQNRQTRLLDEGVTVLEDDLKKETSQIKSTIRRLQAYGVPFDTQDMTP